MVRRTKRKTDHSSSTYSSSRDAGDTTPGKKSKAAGVDLNKGRKVKAIDFSSDDGDRDDAGKRRKVKATDSDDDKGDDGNNDDADLATLCDVTSDPTRTSFGEMTCSHDTENLVTVFSLWLQDYLPNATKRVGAFADLQTTADSIHHENMLRLVVEAAGSGAILVPVVQVSPNITIGDLKRTISDALPQHRKPAWFHLFPHASSTGEPLPDVWSVKQVGWNSEDSVVLAAGACASSVDVLSHYHRGVLCISVKRAHFMSISNQQELTVSSSDLLLDYEHLIT